MGLPSETPPAGKIALYRRENLKYLAAVTPPPAPRSPQALLRLAALVTAVAAMAGCVLFVGDASDLGPTCHFEGELASCGGCIAEHCRDKVNACCGDGRCRSTLDRLDDCAQNGGFSCEEFGALNYSTSATAGQSLSSCITVNCNSSCGSSGSGDTGGGGGGRPPKYTDVNCTGSGRDFCSCSYDATSPNGYICDDTSIDNAICCASYGWPGQSLSCGCERFSCKITGDGCACAASSTGGPNATCEKQRSDYHCCADGVSCQCTAQACYSTQREVDSCTSAVMGCLSSDSSRVRACN